MGGWGEGERVEALAADSAAAKEAADSAEVKEASLAEGWAEAGWAEGWGETPLDLDSRNSRFLPIGGWRVQCICC